MFFGAAFCCLFISEGYSRALKEPFTFAYLANLT